MPILVQKFGGTSVRDAICIKRVAKISTDAQKAGYQVVVVVSAMGDTTDNLLERFTKPFKIIFIAGVLIFTSARAGKLVLDRL